MKKMISLLAVALFAVTFAAGCGKLAKCADAKAKADCEDPKKFEQIDKKDQTCKWTGTPGKTVEEQKTQGTCAAGMPAATLTGAAKECDDIKAEPACTAKATTTADATKKCEWNTTSTKCEVKPIAALTGAAKECDDIKAEPACTAKTATTADATKKCEWNTTSSKCEVK